MPAEDLYALLELDAQASSDEIRAAFRRLAQLHHPDRPGGSVVRMAAINRAYAVLGDPEQRRRYDDALAPRPAPPAAEPSADAPPWQLDLERGNDMDDWRQMYAEERHVWAQLLAAQAPNHPGRAQVEAALRRATGDQLTLENAIRVKAGLGTLSLTEFERQRSAGEQAQQAAGARAGCLLLMLGWR
jgi:curved DNA-binding protein CbpA